MSQPGFEPLTPRYASKTCLKDEKLQKNSMVRAGFEPQPSSILDQCPYHYTTTLLMQLMLKYSYLSYLVFRLFVQFSEKIEF